MSQDYARSYCPTCEPFTDPLREVVVVQWCGAHQPDRGGPDDGKILSVLWTVTSGDDRAYGEDNRAACEAIHRPKEPA